MRPMMMRHLFAAAMMALVAATTLGASAADTAPVTIPVMLPLTGPGAFLGSAEKTGFDVLERELNRTGGIQGRPVRFSYLDDQGNPQVAVQLFAQAASGGTHAVFGGAFSATCKALAPLAEDKRIVLYCLSSGLRPTPGSYTFSAYFYPLDVLARELRYFRERGWTKLAMLVGTDASGQEVDQNYKAMLAQPQLSGLQLVAYERYDPSAVSVTAQVAKINAAKPQAFVVWSGTGMQLSFRALTDSGLDWPVGVNPALQTFAAMNQFADVLPKRLFFANGRWAAAGSTGGAVNAEIVRFYDAFRSAKIAPDVGMNLPWDPGLIVAAALRKLGPNADGTQIHAYIESLHDFPATNGRYDFRTRDQRGITPESLIVTEWSPAKNAWVVPANN